ncbi:MAG: hypothetical protein WCI71_11655, partial [Bacteroidota bacterium]
MKIKAFTRSLQVLVLMLILSSAAWAQTPTSYLCSVRNDSLLTAKIYEFDIYVQNTDPVNIFELGSFQAGIHVNSAILNGGAITATLVAGSSGLVAAQRPLATTFAGSPDYIFKLSPRNGPGLGAGTIISTTSPGTRVIRIRLTNTANFGQFSPNFAFNFTALPYNTVVSAYDQTTAVNVVITNAANHTVATMNNPVLNLPVTAYNMTGGGSYCLGSTGAAVGLSGSENGVNYTLSKNAVPTGAYIPGTGSALSFGNQLAGTYTANGHRKATYLTTAMNGNVITSQTVVNPTLSGPASPCVSATGNVYTTEAGMSGYTWN